VLGSIGHHRLSCVSKFGLALVAILALACSTQAEQENHADASSATGGRGGSVPLGGSGDSGEGVAGGGNAGASGTSTDAASGSDALTGERPGTFVAVGYGGRRARSVDDGVTWTDDTSLVPQGGDDNNLLRTVVWGNQAFVALGWRVMTSPDGKEWKDYGTTIGQWIGAAVYAKGSYVAVGGYGFRATSADGVTWQHHDIDTIASHSHDGLAFGDYQGGRFVVTNDDGVRSYSVDGQAWSPSSGAASTKVTELAFGNEIFVGLGGTNVIVSKDGGATWSASAQLGSMCQGLVFAQGHFTALANGHVFTSADAAVWDDHSVDGISGGAICYGHGTYVFVRDTARRRSKDGINWDAPFSSGMNSWEFVAFGPLS
jgi:hypothetical protein